MLPFYGQNTWKAGELEFYDYIFELTTKYLRIKIGYLVYKVHRKDHSEDERLLM